MNNPHNLPPHERGITPTWDFNKGINHKMSPERRAKKQQRHAANAQMKREKAILENANRKRSA